MLNSFHIKMGLFFSMLLALVQLTIFGLVYYTAHENVFQKSKEQLIYSSRAFNHQISDITKNFREKGYYLTSDPSFIAAAKSKDLPYIEQQLKQLHRGLQADQLLFISENDGILVNTATLKQLHQHFTFSEMLNEAKAQSYAETVLVIDHCVHVFVLLPIALPETVGWIGIGVEIDELLIEEFAKLTPLDVNISFAHQSTSGQWLYADAMISALAGANRSAFDSHIQLVNNQQSPADFRFQDIITLMMPIQTPDTSPAVVALLQYSLDASLAPYQSLLLTLIIFSFFTLAVALMATVWFANRFSVPLGHLSKAIHRIHIGNYSKPIKMIGKDELGLLATSLNHMMHEVSQRATKRQFKLRHDMITKLPNKRHFEDQLHDLLCQLNREHDQGLVVLIDVVRFHQLKYYLGYWVTDPLVHAIAMRLKTLASATLIARFSAQQFILYFAETSIDDSKALTDEIEHLFASAFTVFDTEIDLTIQMGLSAFPNHGCAASQLIQQAEAALFIAQSQQRAVSLYHTAFDPRSANPLSLMRELKSDLADEAFELFYQPTFDSQTQALVLLEAQPRWHHAANGMMLPAQFLPLSEQLGYSKYMTQWCYTTALKQAQHWLNDHPTLHLMLPFSMSDFHFDWLIDDFLATLEATQYAPHQTLIAMAATSFMYESRKVNANIARLQAVGIQFVISDFGEHPLMLQQLQACPIKMLKLNTGMLPAQTFDEATAKTFKALSGLGTGLGYQMMVSQVETAAQARQLQAMGYTLQQGPYYQAILPASQLEVWLATQDTPVWL